MVVYGTVILSVFLKVAFGNVDVITNSTNDERTTAVIPEIRRGQPCTPGKLYKHQCNTCTCTKTQALMCTKMACIDWKNYKVVKEKKALREDENESTVNLLPKVKHGAVCKPGKLYRNKCRRCYCTHKNQIMCSNKTKTACDFNEDGNPVPILTPEDVRPTVLDIEIQDLETLSKASDKCDPGKSYMVDCNFCLCLHNNNLLCQRKMCISNEDMNRLEAKEMSGKPCTNGESKTHNCKTCDCVNGITQCQQVSNCQIEQKILLKGDNAHVPRVLDGFHKKCVPNTIYKLDCNKCYCQPSGNLRCTQKTCLNYSQVKMLLKQREYLEEHNL